MTHAIQLLLIFGVLISMGSSSPIQVTTELVQESANWVTSSPEDQGMDSKVLTALKHHIQTNYPAMYSMVIVRNGFLVAEEYFQYSASTKRNIYSCTKSFISTLIGIAIQEGFIDGVNESVIDFFPNYTFKNLDASKQNMTLFHLLTMTSGLDWDEADYNDPQNPLYLMWDSSNWVQFVLNRSMVAEPGTTFSYNSGASHVMSAILSVTTGMSTLAYATSRLFTPLGIDDYNWPTDPQGIHKGGEGLELTPISLAKLGQLYLDNGSWNGQQLVPEQWIFDTTHSTLTPPSNGYYGYGYQWWLHPKGIFSAWGYAHQRVIVVPECQVVATFTGYMPTISGDPVASLVNEYVLPAIFTHEPYEEPTSISSTPFFTCILPPLLLMVLLQKKIKRT